MYDILDICRYVINYSNDKEYDISNLKLQKLLYFIQAYFLIEIKTPCFHEAIEAWDFGPVVPVAYNEYKQYASTHIPYIESYLEYDINNIWDSIKRVEYNDNIISSNDKNLINAVVDKLENYTATDLVTLTHNQSPWINAYDENTHNEITNQSLYDYFINKGENL